VTDLPFWPGGGGGGGGGLTEAEADALFLTPAEGDALFLTAAEAEALFLTQAEADARYQRLGPPLLVPIGTDLNVQNVQTMAAANAGRCTRVVAQGTGTLRELALYVGAQSGNIDIGVYDVASPRARLFSTGSIACPAGAAWRVLADVGIAVAEGDCFDVIVAADNAVASFGRSQPLTTNAAGELPAGVLPGAGRPILGGTINTVFPLPAAIADAAIAATDREVIVVGRIEP
jgi:hypothetical protein